MNFYKSFTIPCSFDSKYDSTLMNRSIRTPCTIVLLCLLFFVFSAKAGTYSDNHSDNDLKNWSIFGKRNWIEKDGYVTPSNSDQGYQGFLINMHECTKDGIFTCKLKTCGDLNSMDGGIVFRFSDNSHYYFVTITEANSSGHSKDNMVRLVKNSTDARTGYVIIKSGLDFTNCNGVYTIKVRLKGPSFTFWLNGDSLAQYTDSSNTDGSVGYAYDNLPDPYVSYDSSAWIDATVPSKLISRGPGDTTVPVGTSASFSVTTTATKNMVYKWLREPSDSVGNGITFSTGPVSEVNNNTRYCCVVTDGISFDTSTWATLTVINTPRIVLQPYDTNVVSGTNATFYISVYDTSKVNYSWRKTGMNKEIGKLNSLTITTTLNDSGGYYCLVSNPAGSTISDTAHLTVRSKELKSSFAFSPKSGYAPLKVTFTDKSVGDIDSYRWFFGDNDSGSTADIIHEYTKPGLYTVILIVSGAHGLDTLIKKDSILVISRNPDEDNSIVISDLYFDSLTSSVRISWCIDSTTLVMNPEVKFTYSFLDYPTTPAGNTTISVSSRCTDTLIPLKESVNQNVTCYIALWFRTQDGAWIEPTTTSKKNLKIEAVNYHRDVVTFFNDNVNDTTVAFHGKVIFWKDSCYRSNNRTHDTLEAVTLTSLPAGLVPVGLPFFFREGGKVTPFYVGIHIDSLPGNALLSNVRIYSHTNNKFYVNYDSRVDSINKVVYVKTDNLGRTFIPMVDTMAPMVTIYSNISNPVMPGTDVTDLLGITDNIMNVRWKYLYGSGDKRPTMYMQDTLDSAGALLSFNIPDTSAAISSESGLRILFIVDDGCHSDTINLSRSVYRAKSDTLTTIINRWNPVYSTTVLYNNNLDSVIEPLLEFYNVKTYDVKKFRIFQWINTYNNSNTDNKWEEYNPSDIKIKSLFTFEPGRLFWLKTSKTVPFYTVSGYTISLRDTFSFNLQAQQWTDFAMPFRFGVCMKEIISATGSGIDSISIYRWQQNPSTKIFTLEPHFVPGMPERADSTTEIEFIEKGGYSIYNKHSKTVTLRIPPVPATIERKSLKKKVYEENDLWCTRFLADIENLTSLAPVYFGYAPGSYVFPIPPSFLEVRLSILDRLTSEQSGHSISEDAKNGIAKELLISNYGDSTYTIHYHFDKVGAFPHNFKTLCSTPATGALDSCGRITVAPHSVESRWIIIGNADFFNTYVSKTMVKQFSLLSSFPNPSRSIVNIRFTVPFGALEHVNITIYNTLGKKIWQKEIPGFLGNGLNLVTWNGFTNDNIRAGSGLYIVQLEVKNQSNKVIKRFKQNVTLLR